MAEIEALKKKATENKERLGRNERTGAKASEGELNAMLNAMLNDAYDNVLFYFLRAVPTAAWL